MKAWIIKWKWSGEPGAVQSYAGANSISTFSLQTSGYPLKLWSRPSCNKCVIGADAACRKKTVAALKRPLDHHECFSGDRCPLGRPASFRASPCVGQAQRFRLR